MLRLHLINSLSNQIEELIQLIDLFQQNEEEAHYRKEFESEKAHLQNILDISTVNDNYTVAVVGTFKAGKSSFVNALCDSKVASVNTNPETAAITTFHFNTLPYAEIHMTLKKDWDDMKEPYLQADFHGTSRYGELLRLERKKELSGTSIAKLESEYITVDGKVVKISCDNWTDDKSQKKFYKDIQPYVSRKDPRHYLVDRLEVYAPVQFLKNIVLIDTPGLNDADQYRVELTKEKVKEVDVVLFLTPSGNSYSQEDKEFIITTLRRGKIKHLLVIVTKVDLTFEQAKKDADDNDDPIPTLDQHKELQKQRVKDLIERTLDELLDEVTIDPVTKEKFIDQLGSITPVVISSELYKQGRRDDSGIPELKERLQEMFGESERVKKVETDLRKALHHAVDRINSILKKRQETLSLQANAIKATTQTKELGREVKIIFNDSQRAISYHTKEFDDFETNNSVLIDLQIQEVIKNAIKVIEEDLQSEDVTKHWKTRRYGNWGEIRYIQGRIANACFITLVSALQEYIRKFYKPLGHIKEEVNRLMEAIRLAEQRYISEINVPLELDKSIDEKFDDIQDIIDAEVQLKEMMISEKLESFVSEEVRHRLTSKRMEVSAIEGKGTSYKQTQDIYRYYNEIKTLLKDELNLYLKKEIHDFIETMKGMLHDLYPALEEHIQLELDRHLNQMKSTLIQRNEQERIAILERTIDQMNRLNMLDRNFKANM